MARWMVSLGLCVACAVLVLVGPAERTLGAGIRAVYVHVSWVWAGLALGITFTFTSLAAAIVDARRFYGALNRVYAFTVAYLALGLLGSFVAARINWGAIAWDEPRTVAMIRVVLALGVAWPITALLDEQARYRQAALSAVMLACLAWLGVAPRALHPDAPVTDSEAWGMRSVFYGLTLGWLVLAGTWSWPYGAREDREQSPGRPSSSPPSQRL